MCIENTASSANENNQNRREIYVFSWSLMLKYSGPELHLVACIVEAYVYIGFSELLIFRWFFHHIHVTVSEKRAMKIIEK